MNRSRAIAALAAAGLSAVAGCVETCPEEFLTLEQVVSAYNANADAVPRLWARAEMSVELKAPDMPAFTWRSGDPTCLLLLAKGPNRLGPHDFVLLGRESAAVELFRVGSSTRQGVYYFWHQIGKKGGAWYGKHERAGAPGVGNLPLDPLQLLSVLAICPLPDDRTDLPAVVMGMQNTPRDCAYVVTVIDRQAVTGHVLARREVFFRWSEDAPPRPYKVNLLDTVGRRVMTAYLSEYEAIDVSDLDDPPESDPLLPTRIEIVANPVPGVKTFIRRIRLKLSEMTAEDKWDPEACAFRPPPGVSPVQVDRRAARPKPKGTGS